MYIKSGGDVLLRELTLGINDKKAGLTDSTITDDNDLHLRVVDSARSILACIHVGGTLGVHGDLVDSGQVLADLLVLNPGAPLCVLDELDSLFL